jgi:hypothetical protein
VHRVHFRSENPIKKSVYAKDALFNKGSLTGMPQFVEMPAPVTTTIFFDLANAFAISWSLSSQSGPTFVVGISLNCAAYALEVLGLSF